MSYAAKCLALYLAPIGICYAQSDVAQEIQQADSPAQAQALGAGLLKQSRASGEAAAVVWRTGDVDARRNARTVLNEMDEAALAPLLESDGDLIPAEQAWRMTMVVETIDDLRRSAAKMIDRQLANKRIVPLKSGPGDEESTSSRRVCDVAYDLMSHLTADAQDTGFLLRMQQFSRRSETARDAEIGRARQSVAWRALLR
jgi:hypothetical protein